MSDKKFYTAAELVPMFRMSRAGFYLMVSEGKIPSVKIGGKVLIPAWWVDEITAKPQAQAAK